MKYSKHYSTEWKVVPAKTITHGSTYILIARFCTNWVFTLEGTYSKRKPILELSHYDAFVYFDGSLLIKVFLDVEQCKEPGVTVRYKILCEI